MLNLHVDANINEFRKEVEVFQRTQMKYIGNSKGNQKVDVTSNELCEEVNSLEEKQ